LLPIIFGLSYAWLSTALGVGLPTMETIGEAQRGRSPGSRIVQANPRFNRTLSDQLLQVRVRGRQRNAADSLTALQEFRKFKPGGHGNELMDGPGRALLSLDDLPIGDAFGEQLLVHPAAIPRAGFPTRHSLIPTMLGTALSVAEILQGWAASVRVLWQHLLPIECEASKIAGAPMLVSAE
jgi:hypothetical protein